MIKEKIIKKYSKRIELHAHSMPVSSCCDCPIERELELYAQKRVDSICLTNHFFKHNPIFLNKSKYDCIETYLWNYEQFKSLAKPYGINTILGCEIRFIDNINDYLIYGVDREILEESFDYLDCDLKTYRENVILKNSLFIQAHPFRDNIIPVDPNLIDGIETLNFHYNQNSRNAACAFYAKENSISICTGGSDFHHDIDYHAASVLMLSKIIPEDSFELAKLLKNKDYVYLLGDNHIIIP